MKVKNYGILLFLLAGIAFLATACDSGDSGGSSDGNSNGGSGTGGETEQGYYTVAFDVNEGHNGTGAVLSSADPVQVESGDSIILPYPTTDATVDGTPYVMLGFAESSDAAEAAYEPGASYTVTGDATLYAIWKEDTLFADQYYETTSGTIQIVQTASTESGSSGVVIPAYKNGKKITSIGENAFSECTSLESVTIPSSVKSIGNNAFNKCSYLTSVTIPSGVTNIGTSAFYKSGLTSVTIPPSVTGIGGYAFSGCADLTSVEIPSGVTSIVTATFQDCTGLTSVTIPSSVTDIGNFAFLGCTSLTSVKIPSRVTSIGMSAFKGCTSLTSVKIPSSVNNIATKAFAENGPLTIYYAGTETDWTNNITKGDKVFLNTTPTMHYNYTDE